MSSVTLGNKYRDKITGFTGVATGRAEYLDNTPQVFLEPSTQNEAFEMKGRWVGQARLEPAPATAA